jgi:hypothetical protein
MATAIEGLPMWAVDPEVKQFLNSLQFELSILLDEKYQKCITDKPLIIIRQITNESRIKNVDSL